MSNLEQSSQRFHIRKDLGGIPKYMPGKDAPQAVKLSSNEVTHPPLPGVAEAMTRATAEANRYPDIANVKLRTALADSLGLSWEQVAVGVGSSALCQQLVQISAGPGDEVIYPWRSFEAYPIFVQVTGATAVPVPLDNNGANDLDAMADAITDNTKLIFVCNPNNPTGAEVSKAAFERFLKRVPSDVVIALDEAYTEYLRVEDTPLSTELLADHPNLIGLRTFSKAYGLAGVRVGYAFGQEAIIDALNRVALPFGVNVAAQAGALASLEAQQELLERTEIVVRNRDRVADHLGVPRSQANFVWLETTDGQRIAEQLFEQGVIVRAFPEGVRITVTDDEETDRLLAAWDAIDH
ncbi:histidinol-phosphate transaminase [Corynebacterium gerontici]|uniref:Aromatic amino acid aminotransferase n=1 Tax=Corynebacterium gerontici TaxID=2079234 RepID=A0A3G6J2R9_9CORY|nr:histidinol-phosphate transaminase [Corynebacterium gerontici]AZA12361.1 Putative phenylalanine aminotransferase [Corynebacterium gerontici]